MNKIKGVKMGAKSVEQRVNETDNATFPFEKKVMRFDAVPPGQLPTITIPIRNSVGNCKSLEIKNANKGMKVY